MPAGNPGGYANGGGGIDQILQLLGEGGGQATAPVAPQQGPDLFESPLFQEAVAAFIEQNGVEPATDQDFEGPGGVLDIMTSMRGDTSAGAAQGDVLNQMGEASDRQGGLRGDQPPTFGPKDVETVQSAGSGDIREWLGGDVDNIRHLFPPEYDQAVANNDDDLKRQIEEEFVANNPGIILEKIRNAENRNFETRNVLRR